jgi:hypothetical protein
MDGRGRGEDQNVGGRDSFGFGGKHAGFCEMDGGGVRVVDPHEVEQAGRAKDPAVPFAHGADPNDRDPTRVERMRHDFGIRDFFSSIRPSRNKPTLGERHDAAPVCVQTRRP